MSDYYNSFLQLLAREATWKTRLRSSSDIFDDRFAILLYKHVRVLSLWSLIQFSIAIPCLFVLSGTWWYFSLMNWSWGLINLAVAFWLFLHVGREKYRNEPAEYRSGIFFHVKKMLALNIGADTVYILIGVAFFELSKTNIINHPDLWVGFSMSLILQGTYLLIHDSLFLHRHQQNYNRWFTNQNQ